MAEKTEIIIIAPEFLMDLAEDAVEEISGFPGFKAASFEVGYFLKKPLQKRPSRFFISLGDTSDNAYTNQVLPYTLEHHNQNGVCISLNETHAILFGETDHDVTDTLKNIPRETLKSISTLKKRILFKLKNTDKAVSADPIDALTLSQRKSGSMDNKTSRSRIKKAMIYASRPSVIKFTRPSVVRFIKIIGPIIAPYWLEPPDIMNTALQRTIARKRNTQIALKQFLENEFKEWVRTIREG